MRSRPYASGLTFGCGWLLLLPACRSAAEFRAEADRDAYALIQERREQLFSEDGPFSIEPPEDSLRLRMEAGDWTPDKPLGLLDCIRIAAENNREVRTRKERLFRAALDLTLEQWNLGWRPFADSSGSLTETGQVQTARGDADAGFTRILGHGGRVLAGIGTSLFNVVSTGNGWDLVNDLQLSITQPLLRDGGRLVTREPLTQAERNLVYEVRAYERFRRTFALQVASEVYDVLSTMDAMRNEVSNLNTIKALTERNRALAEAGRQSDLQVDQALQDELRSENRLLRLTAQLEGRYDNFYLFLGLPIDSRLRLDIGELDRLTPTDVLFAEVDGIAEEPSVARALDARLDFMTVRDQLVDRERQVEVIANALQAGLDLSAGINAASDSNQPFDFSADNFNWNLGIAFELPVDRVAERNAYRNAIIAVEAARRNVQEQGDAITIDVRAGLRNLKALTESYEIQRGAIVLGERRVESSQLKLEAGRASTRDLLESQDSLLEARNAATGALIDLTLARLGLYLEIEVLLVDDGGLRVDDEVLQQILEASPGAPPIEPDPSEGTEERP